MNFFDTANVYAHGGAEEVLGPILKELDRDALVVATKVYFPTGEEVERAAASRANTSAIKSNARSRAFGSITSTSTSATATIRRRRSKKRARR